MRPRPKVDTNVLIFKVVPDFKIYVAAASMVWQLIVSEAPAYP